MRSILLRASLLSAAVVVAGCTGGGDGSEPDAQRGEASGVVAISAREYSYDLPSDVHAGSISFEFTNDGDHPHEFALARLDEGMTIEDLGNVLAADEVAEPGIETLPGVSVLSPGLSAVMTADLEAGSYALYCFLPTPSGAKHFEQGMIASFEVGPEAGDASTPEPDAVFSVDDEGYELADVDAGRRVIEFRNEKDDLPHAFQLVSYDPGRHKAYVDAWLQGRLEGPAPAIFPGGARDVPPGRSVVMEIEFESGRTYTVNDPVAAAAAEIVVE